MRILLINQHLCDSLGGSEIQCDLIAQAFTALGHEVLYGIVHPGKMDYHSIYATKKLQNPFIFSYYRTLREFRPDIVYWRFHKHHLFICSLIAKLLNISFVFAISSRYDIRPWIWQRPRPRQGQDGRQNNTIELLRYIVALGRSLRTLWNSLGILFVDACTSLNPDFLHKLPVKRQAHIPNSMSNVSIPFVWPKPYVAWVSNLKASKNPEYFLELAASLQDMDTDFVMVGRIHDPRYKFIAETAEETPCNFHYLGQKSPDQVNGILRSSLFLVHTCSREEGFGNIFIQAWMQGRPTISLYFDPNLIITRNSLGFVSGSMDQLVMDVKYLIKNPDLISEMGIRAKDFAAKRFDINNNIKILEKFLLSVSQPKTCSADV